MSFSPEPRLDLLYRANVELGAPTDLGATPHGHRVIVPITGGSIEGPRIRAKICPGADWITIRPDGVSDLDVRVTLQTDDGALIYTTMRGLLTNLPQNLERLSRGEDIPRDSYYFGLVPTYETSDPRYAWLQQTIVIASATMLRNGVQYDAYTVG